MTKAEADFWLSEEVAAKAPKQQQPFFKAREAVAPYVASGKLKIFDPGDRLVAGVAAVPTSGHTPGHAGYLFESGKERLLVWGDVVHSHAVQFARPEVAIEFVVDNKQATQAARKHSPMPQTGNYGSRAHTCPFRALAGFAREKLPMSGYRSNTRLCPPGVDRRRRTPDAS